MEKQTAMNRVDAAILLSSTSDDMSISIALGSQLRKIKSKALSQIERSDAYEKLADQMWLPYPGAHRHQDYPGIHVGHRRSLQRAR